MKKLTDKELEIMNILWDKGAFSMRDLIEQMPDPKPHFNTLSTYVHRLETHGMITHKALGPRFFLYEAAMTREKYAEMVHKDSINKFFKGSYMDFISQLVTEQEISVDDLKELIKLIEG